MTWLEFKIMIYRPEGGTLTITQACVVFVLTWLEFKIMIYHTEGEHFNHYTSDVVDLLIE